MLAVVRIILVNRVGIDNADPGGNREQTRAGGKPDVGRLSCTILSTETAPNIQWLVIEMK